jgi:hypothetical protein
LGFQAVEIITATNGTIVYEDLGQAPAPFGADSHCRSCRLITINAVLLISDTFFVE